MRDCGSSGLSLLSNIEELTVICMLDPYGGLAKVGSPLVLDMSEQKRTRNFFYSNLVISVNSVNQSRSPEPFKALPSCTRQLVVELVLGTLS